MALAIQQSSIPVQQALYPTLNQTAQKKTKASNTKSDLGEGGLVDFQAQLGQITQPQQINSFPSFSVQLGDSPLVTDESQTKSIDSQPEKIAVQRESGRLLPQSDRTLPDLDLASLDSAEIVDFIQSGAQKENEKIKATQEKESNSIYPEYDSGRVSKFFENSADRLSQRFEDPNRINLQSNLAPYDGKLGTLDTTELLKNAGAQIVPDKKAFPSLKIGHLSSGSDYLNTMAQMKSSAEPLSLSLQNEKAIGNAADPTHASQLIEETGDERTLTAQSDSRLKGKKNEQASSDPYQMITEHASELHTASSAAPHTGSHHWTEIKGQVVQGSLAQDRLSTDSLAGITQTIHGFSKGVNGNEGQMKIQLKPDHLGSIEVRVTTVGSQVNLQIQSSSEKSKKIIEESLNSLKESLSAQNLNLNQVELSLFLSSKDADQDLQKQQAQLPQFQDNFLGDTNHNRSRHSQDGNGQNEFSSPVVPSRAALASRLSGLTSMTQLNSAKTDLGRIDVRA
jgi:flagellar hook-length control protein FliK